jgi:hypothetical protein
MMCHDASSRCWKRANEVCSSCDAWATLQSTTIQSLVNGLQDEVPHKPERDDDDIEVLILWLASHWHTAAIDECDGATRDESAERER